MSARKAVVTAVAGGLILAAVKGSAQVASAPPAAVAADVSGNVAEGQRLAAQAGFTGSQWDCLYTLWQGESNWSRYADSETTGLTGPGAPFAYGIPQAYPSTKLPLAAQPASAGGSSSARAEIRWGLRYIETTYGTPCSALAFKRAHGNKGY